LAQGGEPDVAGLIATTISYLLFITLAIQLVGPWLNRQPLTVALSALLWVHAFRHVALQIFSAQRFGFALSDLAAAEIAWGDVAGACLALAGLWLLHVRARIAFVVVWLFAIESVLDLLNATIAGVREQAFESAHAVTWLILTFYVPALWTSVVLVVWQLLTRRSNGQEALLSRTAKRSEPD
jgi:hypothetical protein